MNFEEVDNKVKQAVESAIGYLIGPVVQVFIKNKYITR